MGRQVKDMGLGVEILRGFLQKKNDMRACPGGKVEFNWDQYTERRHKKRLIGMTREISYFSRDNRMT